MLQSTGACSKHVTMRHAAERTTPSLPGGDGSAQRVLCPWWPRPLPLTFKDVFPVNLAQIRSAIPEIFDSQTKKVTDSAKNRTLHSSLHVVNSLSYHSRISWQFLAQFWRSSCGGRLIRGSCHSQSQQSAWRLSVSERRSLCVSRTRRGCQRGSEWPRRDVCCCCRASHCNLTPFQHSDHARPSFSQSHTPAVSCHASCVQ